MKKGMKQMDFMEELESSTMRRRLLGGGAFGQPKSWNNKVGKLPFLNYNGKKQSPLFAPQLPMKIL